MPEPLGCCPEDVRRVSTAKHHPLEAPVDLRVSEAIPLLLPNLDWLNLNRVPAKLRIANTGRTVILSPRWSGSGPRLRGGPLRGEYILSQIHFHWSRGNDVGSEHSVDGKRLPLEMHAVSYNSEYESHEKALTASDGTVVTAFFFLLQERDNPALAELTAALAQVAAPRATTRHPPFALSRLVPAMNTDYLIYWGNVGPADVKHRLLWLLDRKPIAISYGQMSMFRRVHQLDEGGPGSEPAPFPPPGSVFYADPTRRPPSAPTLLPLGASTSPRLSDATAALMSHRTSKSFDATAERQIPGENSYEVYKSLQLDQWNTGSSERPFAGPGTMPVGFTFKSRRGPAEDEYVPRAVSFNRINQVQFPNRRKAVETNHGAVTSSESSDTDSTRTSYYTTQTSVRKRARTTEGGRRGQPPNRAASPSADSISSSSSGKRHGNRAKKNTAAWSSDSLNPSIELACSDLGVAPGNPSVRRTRPSIINTCGIEDLLIETITPAIAPARTSRVMKQHPEVAAIISSRSRLSNCRLTSCRLPSALSRDHPNAQPFLDKSQTGAAVAGSFVQMEQAQRNRDIEKLAKKGRK